MRKGFEELRLELVQRFDSTASPESFSVTSVDELKNLSDSADACGPPAANRLRRTRVSNDADAGDDLGFDRDHGVHRHVHPRV